MSSTDEQEAVLTFRSLEAGLVAPRRMRAGDAAVDLPARDAGAVLPGQRRLVPTGFEVAVPAGFAGLVLPRSGLALNSGVTVLNAPGLIDPGYRGELKIVLMNFSAEPFTYERGDRIAQFLVVAVADVAVVAADTLPPAPDDRGSDGFGSSG